MPEFFTRVAALFTHATSELLKPLRTSSKHSKLQLSPTDLTQFSVFIVIGLFICRKVKHLCGLGTSFVPAVSESENASDDRDSLFRLPDSSLEMPLKFDHSHRSMFVDAVSGGADTSVDIEDSNALMAIYLGALSETAMILLLCKRECPVSPLGAVKVRNRFELIRPETCRSLLAQSHASNTTATPRAEEEGQTQPRLLLYARYPRPARRVKRGIEIDIEVAVVTRNQLQKSAESADTPVFRQEMTILQFRKWKRGPRPSESRPSVQPTSDTATSPSSPSHVPITESSLPQHDPNNAKPLFTTSLGVNSPRQWARLCKDYNPIHVLPWAARLFGLSGVIAHGNHAVAACIWAMAGAARVDPLQLWQVDADPLVSERTKRFVLQKLGAQTLGDEASWWMEVRFRSMLFLPASFGPTAVANDERGFKIVTSRSSKAVVEVEVGVI